LTDTKPENQSFNFKNPKKLKIQLAKMESELFIVESSEHNQIIFENVPEFYCEGRPVECLFRLTGSFKVEPTDFIGIFKVRV
jgi:hypothetical protein